MLAFPFKNQIKFETHKDKHLGFDFQTTTSLLITGLNL